MVLPWLADKIGHSSFHFFVKSLLALERADGLQHAFLASNPTVGRLEKGT